MGFHDVIKIILSHDFAHPRSKSFSRKIYILSLEGVYVIFKWNTENVQLLPLSENEEMTRVILILKMLMYMHTQTRCRRENKFY